MKVSREDPCETPTAYFSQLLLSGTKDMDSKAQ